MFSNLILTFVAASSLLSVQAQSSAAIPGVSSVPSCVLNCSSTAAVASGCVSFTNVTCVCTSTKFQASALACLQSNCTASDQAAATSLQSSLCGSNSTSTSGSPSSTASASATSPASSSTKSSAAVPGLNIGGLHVGHAIGIVTILTGVITATVL